ncbi:MAG: sulfurtransferase [Nitrospinae bacterium]|nr:sulfurtransferase [Nitrospinota bacterium]
MKTAQKYFLLLLAGMFALSACSGTTSTTKDSQNPSGLVDPAWVNQLIEYHRPGSSSAAPAGYSHDRAHRYVIFETQWGPVEQATAYIAGHVPGAFHSDSDTYENGFPRWFLLPDEELKAAAGRMGITADATVVVYSDSSIFATRLWWILTYLGVSDVRIMNGGYAAWVASGYAGESAINTPTPATYAGTINANVRATTDYVASVYTSATAQLVDVRSEDEYRGIISGYDYVEAMGRIPGATWAYDADSASPYYTNADGTLRSADEVLAMWRSLGITFDREVIFYCGGGYRSALAYFYASLLGYDNVRNYSDGWEGWSTTYTQDASENWIQTPSGRPIASGE